MSGRITGWLDRIDAALADNAADRAAHAADPTIDVLVDVGKLKPDARGKHTVTTRRDRPSLVCGHAECVVGFACKRRP